MIIHGFTKTTLLDYPGHVASTVFTGGCNFRCPFCHNGNLVLHPNDYPTIAEDEILAFLKKRKGIVSGVCISGGEPTLQQDLPSFISKIKSLDILVKLDTNGYRPDVLKSLVSEDLIDYVAMDIKAGRNNYGKACGLDNVDMSKIEESASFLLKCNLPYEFRTTVVNGIHTDEDFKDIAIWIGGAKKYFLQSYTEKDSVIDKTCKSFSDRYLDHFLNIVIKTIPSAELRGID